MTTHPQSPEFRVFAGLCENTECPPDFEMASIVECQDAQYSRLEIAHSPGLTWKYEVVFPLDQYKDVSRLQACFFADALTGGNLLAFTHFGCNLRADETCRIYAGAEVVARINRHYRKGTP